MDVLDSRRILIVAHRSVATPALIDTVRQRTEEGPCTFALLIPDAGNPVIAAWTLRRARRCCQDLGAAVDGIVAEGADAYTGIASALRVAEYDEILLSMLSGPGSGWLREDLPARVEALGIRSPWSWLTRSRRNRESDQAPIAPTAPAPCLSDPLATESGPGVASWRA